MPPTTAWTIASITAADRPDICAFVRGRWGDDVMVVRGERYRPAELPGFVAREGGGIVGLVTYRADDDGWEIGSLDSVGENRGIGTALLAAVEAAARTAGARRVFLVTTNDNLRALGFYQRRGYRIVGVAPGAVERARRIKPSIPLVGDGGIPLRDEIELERRLNGNGDVCPVGRSAGVRTDDAEDGG